MSAGRCSGCGASNRSCKVIREHIRTCSRYRDLLRSDPEKALEPEDEQRRWVQEDRAGERSESREQLISAADDRRAKQESRFDTPADILE